MSTVRDGCVVATEPLADLLHTFVTRWNATRPSTSGQFVAKDTTPVPFVGAVAWLAEETRQHDPDLRGVAPDAIQRIIGRRSKVTELRTADLLVQALECPYVFHDGTLEIQPNPAAPQSARAACCGGSTLALVLEQISEQFGRRPVWVA